MLRRIFYSSHRLLGLLICLFLSMWFITGLVLIYHPYPGVDNEQRASKLETIPYDSSLVDIQDVIGSIPQEEKIKSVKLNRLERQTIFRIQTNENYYMLSADSLKQPSTITHSTVQSVAQPWSDGSIQRIDTVYKRDVWVMFNRYIKELPLYKVYFDDPEKHELYISSRTGEVQQFTNRKERIGSYFGFIPHKLYIPALRGDSKRWAQTFTILSIIALIVGITGVYVGIDAYVRQYRRTKKATSPFRKKAYVWHHVFGIVFGLLLITWSISGALSIKKIPQWIMKIHHPISSAIQGKPVAFDHYLLDYRTILAEGKQVKEIEWSYFQGKPVYTVNMDNQTLSLDASTDEIKALYLEPSDIEKVIQKNHGDIAHKIELIHAYENYYLPWRKELPLPVYKVSVLDEDHSLYYINPTDGACKYVGDNRKARKWLFNGLHYFHIQWLMERPALWTIVIWTTVVGCTVVCLTGVWISGRYLRRKWRKLKKKVNR